MQHRRGGFVVSRVSNIWLLKNTRFPLSIDLLLNNYSNETNRQRRRPALLVRRTNTTYYEGCFGVQYTALHYSSGAAVEALMVQG